MSGRILGGFRSRWIDIAIGTKNMLSEMGIQLLISKGMKSLPKHKYFDDKIRMIFRDLEGVT